MAEPVVGGRRRHVIFWTACIAILMASIDSTIVATALPTITKELHTSLTWSTWTITIYSVGQIVSLPIAGRLSDSLGRRRMFLFYVGLFTAASLLAGLATNVYLLIALRLVQALGGGGLMPSTMGVVSDLFTKERDRALGLVGSFFPLGALLGPTLGGFIVTYFSWREIFFVNVPVGVVLMVLLWLLLPAGRQGGRPRIDVAGAALMAGTLLSVMFGISQFEASGVGSPLPWSFLALGGVLGAGFLRQQRRSSEAILPPVLVRRPSFAVINAINVLYGAAAFGIFTLVPLYAQVTYKLSPLAAGSLLSVRAVGMAVLSILSSLMLRRLGYRRPMLAGFLLLALGLAMISIPSPLPRPLTWLTISALICGVAVGTAGPPANNVAIQLMPDQVAAISGLRAMFRQTGGILAITVAAVIISGRADAGQVLGQIFLIFAILTVLMTPAIFRVPERPGQEISRR